VVKRAPAFGRKRDRRDGAGYVENAQHDFAKVNSVIRFVKINLSWVCQSPLQQNSQQSPGQLAQALCNSAKVRP
jgi:hypothetical protein